MYGLTTNVVTLVDVARPSRRSVPTSSHVGGTRSTPQTGASVRELVCQLHRNSAGRRTAIAADGSTLKHQHTAPAPAGATASAF